MLIRSRRSQRSGGRPSAYVLRFGASRDPPSIWSVALHIAPSEVSPHARTTRQPPSRKALAHPRRHRDRPAHGRARRDDREHRPAVRAGGARLRRRRAPVDRHGLRARLRQPPAPRRSHRRPASAASASSSSACSASPARASSAVSPQSFGVLVGARALQGVFGALLAPGALSLLTTTFTEPEERAKAFGVFGAVAVGGAAIGLLLGGILTEYLSWRWCLYVNLIIAVPAALAAQALLHNEVPAIKPRLDIPGTVTASTGLFAIVYGFSNAQTHSWSAPLTIGMLVAGVVLLAGFVAIQQPRRQPAAAAARRARPRSRRLVPRDGPRRVGDVRRLPLPDVLPPAEPRLLADQDGSGVPADDRHDHHRGDLERRRELLPRIGPRPLIGSGMIVASAGLVSLTGVGTGHGVRVARPARAARHGRRHGARLQLGDGDRDVRRRAARTPASHRRWSTRCSRSAARSAPRCSARSPRRRRPAALAGQARDAGGAVGGRRARLHDRLLVGGGDLRDRRRALHRPAVEPQPRGRGARRASRRSHTPDASAAPDGRRPGRRRRPPRRGRSGRRPHRTTNDLDGVLQTVRAGPFRAHDRSTGVSARIVRRIGWWRRPAPCFTGRRWSSNVNSSSIAGTSPRSSASRSSPRRPTITPATTPARPSRHRPRRSGRRSRISRRPRGASPPTRAPRGVAVEAYERPSPQLPAIPPGQVKHFRVVVYEHVTKVSDDVAPQRVWSFAVNGSSSRGTGLSTPMVVHQGDHVEMTFVNGGTRRR